MKPLGLLACLCGLTGLACTSPRSEPRSTNDTASSAVQEHLPGENVRRFPMDSDFVERYRYVLQGQRVGRDCLYRSRPVPADKQDQLETVLEEDLDRCVAIRIVGHAKGGQATVFRIEPGDNVRTSTGSTRRPH